MRQAEWLLYSTVYSLDVRSFQDSDADGLGDLQGLISRLDYLQELGVDCVWLAPFFTSKDVMFPTVEDSNWAHEAQVDAYYYHTFYHHQADLNMSNPLVQQEILRIMDYWMGTGIAGFRVDAVPRILKPKGGKRIEGDPYELLNVWRNKVQSHDPEAYAAHV